MVNFLSVASVNDWLTRNILRLERFFFAWRKLVLAVLVVFSLVMAWFGAHLRMQAGFEKQLPVTHPYIRMYEKYKHDIIGANRLTVVVRVRKGTIWTRPALTRLYQVTQAVMFLPNVSRSQVQSLWTPNTYVNQITENGFRANPVIPESVTPSSLTPEVIDRIRRAVKQGNYVGSLVSNDRRSAMITAEVHEYNATGKRIDYMAYNRLLERDLRDKF